MNTKCFNLINNKIIYSFEKEIRDQNFNFEVIIINLSFKTLFDEYQYLYLINNKTIFSFKIEIGDNINFEAIIRNYK